MSNERDRTESSGSPVRDEIPAGVSRRSFLKGAGGVAAVGVAVDAAEAAVRELQDSEVERLDGWVQLELQVNGKAVPVRVQPRTTLLNALRNYAEPPLTGAKLVCDRGNCGACTVLVNGEPVYACMMLAADAVGASVATVEGLDNGGELNEVQEAFCEHDASMCGFCTPGYLMSITALLERNPSPTEDDVRTACAGNLCRCGTQPHVFTAALDAARKLGGEAR